MRFIGVQVSQNRPTDSESAGLVGLLAPRAITGDPKPYTDSGSSRARPDLGPELIWVIGSRAIAGEPETLYRFWLKQGQTWVTGSRAITGEPETLYRFWLKQSQTWVTGSRAITGEPETLYRFWLKQVTPCLSQNRYSLSTDVYANFVEKVLRETKAEEHLVVYTGIRGAR